MDKYDKQINFLMAKKNISKKQAKIKQLKLELFKTDHYYLFLFYKKFIRKNGKVHVDTFTKRWINRIMWFSCIWISMSYFLVLQGFGQYAESLSQTVCVTVIGAMIPYLIKSFFETYFEKKNTSIEDIKNQINGITENIISPSSSFDNDVVG